MKVVTERAEDLALVEGLKQGDLETLEKIYRNFGPPINGFIVKHGGNAEDAKDIFQEAVMVLYRLVRQPNFTLTCAFFTLLFPICRNLWFKSIRNRPYFQEIGEASELSDPMESDIEEIMTQREIEEMFRNKLSQLGDQCQQLLKLFFDEVKMKEIVKRMGLSSVSFAKKKKFQCKEQLVKLVRRDPLYRELTA